MTALKIAADAGHRSAAALSARGLCFAPRTLSSLASKPHQFLLHGPVLGDLDAQREELEASRFMLAARMGVDAGFGYSIVARS